ncbi:MAG: S-layer homology domain-containing protein, partial [Faecousia sp.]
GQIGAGGYYPSYEYYTMALDKGWHVAPTNNQDNHKGKWGNANDARDVVLTDDFSEEGLFAAIRQYKVYATEDKNLEILYTVNGLPLGSQISEVPEKLEISVSVVDPDKTDSISKVEVIVNSGKTAYTWDDPAVLATGELTCELTPEYSYYYIRVTEGDGDLAVTAPVWVGETLKLGISGMECGTSTPVTDEELTITTTLFNSEATGATVKSIVYTTNGSEVIGTDTTERTIPASGTLAVEFKYTPKTAKVMTVTAHVTVVQDGKEYEFTKDLELDVLNSADLLYIGIDASHHNEYVAGNYKDSMGNFGNLAAGYSLRTVILSTSEDLIAAAQNANGKYRAIILTAPSRRDGSALRDPYDTYSNAEIEALVAFNKAGGTVVLCGWGDYYESYSQFPQEDHMSAQQNKILAALGSSIRVSDDETKDDTWNGGQSQRLYLSSYDFDNFLMEGVEYDAQNPHNNMYTELYSQYGGASIYVVDAEGKPTTTIPSTVTPAVYGFDTTDSSDDDKDNYGGLGAITKYSFDGADRLMVMATEELEGRGLIVVAGAAFLSNFEVQATISDSGAEKNYSNYKICENLCNYLNPIKITDIAEVQAQTETGYKYTIEGVVTSNASGYDKDTAFFDCIYVQDETAGICCFPVAGNFMVGDVVRITGTTDFYQGEAELQVTAIEVLYHGNPMIPKTVTSAQINDRSVQGSLVTLKGTVVDFQKENGLIQTIMVEDAEGDVARVFIDGYITTSKDVENIYVGCKITATGLASYDDTFNAPEGPFPRIRVRDRADVVCENANEITIFYTNDVHTYVDNSGLRYSHVAQMKDELEEAGRNVLLVDAGDHVQGTAYGSMDNGKSIIELMNAAGYDAATLGNHEFDYGMARTMEIIKESGFTYLSANFYHEKDGVVGDPVLDAYKVFDFDGVKVAIVGLTTPESFTKSTPAYFQDENGNYIYGIAGGSDGAALYEAAQKAIDAANEEADYVIALGHLGDDPSSKPWTSVELIQNTTGIDAFIDGHSHSAVEMREVKNKDGETVVLTQTGSYLAAVGQLTITADGKITSKLITSFDTKDEAVQEIEEAWIQEVNDQLGVVIGYTDVILDNYDENGKRLVRKQETNTGDFAADALYFLFKDMGLDVDLAIMNGGGVRNKAVTGELSYLSCKSIHTFGNVACLQTVTGQQILDALEWGAREANAEGTKENGGFLHVSGVTYEIHTYIPSTVQKDDKGVWIGGPTGEYRVKNVMILNNKTGEYEPLDLKAEYNMAGYNYTLRDMGDGFNMFTGAVNVLDYVAQDYMVLANYVKSFPVGENGLPYVGANNSVLGADYSKVTGEGRITLVNEPEVVFEDVQPDDWFYDAVMYCNRLGIVNGMSPTIFAPNTAMSRAMMVTMLYRLDGEPEVDPTTSFVDVKKDEWYGAAVAWASANGITNGVDATHFAPDEEMTREQMVTFLYRYAKYAGYDVTGSASLVKFSDAASIEEYARVPFAWAVAEGVIKGVTTTTLAPKSKATRAEAAMVIMRLSLLTK